MIARLWRGETRSEDADAYEDVLRATGVRDYRATSGNLGVWLLRQSHGSRTEFLLVTLWDSLESIVAFAGPRIELARNYDVDRDYLLDFHRTVEHFVVAGAWDDASSVPLAA